MSDSKSKSHVAGFGPDINNEGQLGFKYGNRLFSYAEYGSATDLAIEQESGYEQSLHFINVPYIGPAFEISITGSAWWQSEGTIDTNVGELFVEHRQGQTEGKVFGWEVGHAVEAGSIRAMGKQGTEIFLQGDADQPGVLLGDSDQAYAHLDSRNTVEIGTIASEVANLLKEPGDSVHGYFTTVVSEDGSRNVYVRAASDTPSGHPLDPDPTYQYMFDGESGTYLQRAMPAVGDQDFLMRPAAVDEFEQPGNGGVSEGDPIAGGDDQVRVTNQGSDVAELPVGGGEHPAGEAAYTSKVALDAPRGSTPVSNWGEKTPTLDGAGTDWSGLGAFAQPGSTYIIQPGDTLSEIAAAASVSVGPQWDHSGTTVGPQWDQWGQSRLVRAEGASR